MKINFGLDRLEGEHEHYYSNVRGTQQLEMYQHEGFIKCKLIHSKQKSIIVPDLIYIMLDESKFRWIQFYSFLPCLLTKFSEDEIVASILVDISFGHVLGITITNEGHLRNFQDNSNLFKCRIQGPENLSIFTTGNGELVNGVPYIELYHHTLPENKELITQGGFFKCSAWNYQGTKELLNFSYCYFTSLPEIKKPNDLKMIAMSSDEKLQLIVDGTDEIIELKVYRESTSNRTACLNLLIDSSIIESNHLWEHENNNGLVYYEKSHGFIYRVGVKVKTTISFTDSRINRQDNIKLLKYLIIGDTRSKDGIIAPFEEEETEHIFKIELFPDDETNLLKFWFDNGKTDLYTKKDIEELKTKKS